MFDYLGNPDIWSPRPRNMANESAITVTRIMRNMRFKCHLCRNTQRIITHT